MSDKPEAIEIETGEHPDAAVILLHGLGASGNDFEPVVRALALPERQAIRFVLPNAPSQPITINGGMIMPAWYDIRAMGGGDEDSDGIRASERILKALIQREQNRGIESERIILAGFSQGGAIALHTALRHEQRLGGVIALSTYLPLAELATSEQAEPSRDLPVFMVHGLHDDMIQIDRAQRSRNILTACGMDISWHEYPMSHEVCLEEVQAMAAWLSDRL